MTQFIPWYFGIIYQGWLLLTSSYLTSYMFLLGVIAVIIRLVKNNEENK